MSCLRPHLYFPLLPRTAANRHPHQPNLLKHLEGWPKHWAGSRNFLIRFAGASAQDLKCLPSNAYDLVVVGAETGAAEGELIGQLVRVARQGLISLR